MKAGTKSLFAAVLAVFALNSAGMAQQSLFFGYSGDTLPSQDGWEIGGVNAAWEASYASLSDGVLRIHDYGTAGGQNLFYKRSWQPNDGWGTIAEFRMSIQQASSAFGAGFATSDGKHHMAFQFFPDRIIPAYNDGSVYGAQLPAIFHDNTQQSLFRMEIDGDFARLYIDGELVLNAPAGAGTWASVTGVIFGAGSSAAVADMYIDQINCYQTLFGEQVSTPDGGDGTGDGSSSGDGTDGTGEGSSPDGTGTGTSGTTDDGTSGDGTAPDGSSDPNSTNDETNTDPDNPGDGTQDGTNPDGTVDGSTDGTGDGTSDGTSGTPEEEVPAEETLILEIAVDLDTFVVYENGGLTRIAALIEMPEGYSICDINCASVLLDDLVPAACTFRADRGDKGNIKTGNASGISKDKLKSAGDDADTTEASSEHTSSLASGCESQTAILEFDAVPFIQSLSTDGVLGLVEVFITGELEDGTPFEGSDHIMFTK